MNQLNAIRTFAKPGFCPAKQTRIFADRYYIVRMQNTERDMGDGYYLADGEYIEVLPGSAARERRDARLNHCNAVEEWTGEVFAVLTSSYGHWDTSRKPLYTVSETDAKIMVDRARATHDKWLAECEKALAQHEEKYLQKPESWRQGAIENCKRVIAENRDSFRFETLKVR